MEKGQEVITLKITKEAFEEMYNLGLVDLKTDQFEIYKVDVFDEQYPEDERWVKLKEASRKAYKELKDYEFFLRHDKNTNSSDSEQLST